MAKVYGNRWETISSLPRGGQAEVFLVRDLTGEYSTQLALKRVLNVNRHERFRNEVETIKRLVHPNIIKLIDHSALSYDGATPDKQFIVMPFATEGDLSRRVALYKDNPDSVIQVAESLASALQAAHAAGIVHRDVKPQNILFPTVGHDVWLGDFGICLIRNVERYTDTSEVVGPHQFIAPELEGGGQLSVSPAADIYSFGKVIYFMLSGGVTLPRERLQEEEYSRIFSSGERQRLFETLLCRMICPLKDRIQTMDKVQEQLSIINSWGKNAHLPIQLETLSVVEGLKKRAVESQKQKTENAAIRSRREAAISRTRSGALSWFRAELQAIASIIGDGPGLTAGVRDVNAPDDGPRVAKIAPDGAVELWFRNDHERFAREHILRITFGLEFGITFQTVVGAQPSIPNVPVESETAAVAIYPAYAIVNVGATPSRTHNWQGFARDGRFQPLNPSAVPRSGGRRINPRGATTY